MAHVTEQKFRYAAPSSPSDCDKVGLLALSN